MPLSLQLLARPGRVAALVGLAAAAALLSGTLAVGGHAFAPAAALVATGSVLGVLAPLYGRGAAVGLWTARTGIAVGAVALVLPESRPAVALRIAAALAVVAGLRLVARGLGRTGDLPVWTCLAVAVGVGATLAAPALGGGVLLGVALLAVAAAIHATFAAPASTAPQRA